MEAIRFGAQRWSFGADYAAITDWAQPLNGGASTGSPKEPITTLLHKNRDTTVRTLRRIVLLIVQQETCRTDHAWRLPLPASLFPAVLNAMLLQERL